LFPDVPSIAVEGVLDEDGTVRIECRSTASEAACSQCGVLSGRVHGWCARTLADVPMGGRNVLLVMSLRRMTCLSAGCPRRTFREQIPGMTRRWARRTDRLSEVVARFGIEVAGRAGVRLLQAAGVAISRDTVLRTVMRRPLPHDPALGPVPRVLSVDDVAIRRGQRYATMIIDAETHRRVDVLPDRLSGTLADWLKAHPGVEIVCRDGSSSYAEAIRQGAPVAVQVSDRWHLWHGLGDAVEKTVVAHAGCWKPSPGRAVKTAPPAAAAARVSRPIDERTAARHKAVHDFLGQGVGLLECARRLGWALNTVKRYARAETSAELQRPPHYRRTLVDPYRDHLRRKLIDDPTVPVTRLLAEIRQQGYAGSANLLVRYINQGRLDLEQAPPAPRKVKSWIMTRPDDLPAAQNQQLSDIIGLCPELDQLTDLVRRFADMLTNRQSQKLSAWIESAHTSGFPALRSFVNGLKLDLEAVTAGLTLPFSNGPMEGANTKVKLLKRQIYGRAGFPLLRQRILLN
jgi:transposase